MPTTFNPVFASSNAVREPVNPTPIVTTSTGFRRFAIFRLLGFSSGDARIHVYAAVRILADTGRCPIDLDAVLIDHVVVRSVGSGKADHPPRHHVAVAAVNRVAEVTLQSALPQMREEDVGGHPAKLLTALFEMSKIGVLLVRTHAGERRSGVRHLFVDGGERSPEEFRRRERQLIS